MLFADDDNKPLPGDAYIPSVAPLLVSLFLILLCFFIALTKDLDLAQPQDKSKAIRSIHETFGKPEEEGIGFGGMVKPKIEEYVLEIEKLLSEYANIETTSNGDTIRISIPKDFLFYGDEANFKPEKAEVMINLAEILKKMKKDHRPYVAVVNGLENYELDKQRIKSFKSLAGFNLDTGLSAEEPTSFTIMVDHE